MVVWCWRISIRGEKDPLNKKVFAVYDAKYFIWGKESVLDTDTPRYVFDTQFGVFVSFFNIGYVCTLDFKKKKRKKMSNSSKLFQPKTK